MTAIRACRADDVPRIVTIINAAAQRYRGEIPDDCWHEPYMSVEQLEREIGAGVMFWGYEDGHTLLGVMGIQRVKDVTLVRHAYVDPHAQGRGIGGILLRHLEALTPERILIGTWTDAAWAIRFYQSHGYTLIPPRDVSAILRSYWDIPARQVETSVVLSKTARAS